MLFERQMLTPQGRLVAIEQLFEQLARREGSAPDEGHVPVAVLEAFAAFETPVRHLMEAAMAHCKDRAALAHWRKTERCLNALPEALMGTLRAEANAPWLNFYRRLIELHGLLTDAPTAADAEEYAAMLQRMVQLAGAVSRHSPVRMEAEQAFTLLLMQVELQRQNPKKAKRKPKRRKKAKRRPATKRATKESGAAAS